jgi:hypothetical protein
MNPRERILALAAAGILSVILLGVMLHQLVLAPAAALDQRIAEAQAKRDSLMLQLAKGPEYRQAIRQVALRAYDLDEQQASERARTRLVDMLQRSGLSLDRLSLRPVRGPRVPSTYQEIAWLLSVRGKPEQIVNCLYLLQRDPYLHRLDNLTLAPVARSQDVELRLRYATLVLLYPKDQKPIDPRKDEPPRLLASLDDAQRSAYALIAQRDLFRPYMPAVAHRPEHEPSPEPTPVSDNPLERLRVVGLPTWNGQPEIILYDDAASQTRTLAVGDELAGGVIVLVDYRNMPMPGNAMILSTSRVIVRIDQTYWAIELGQSVGERHELDSQQIPPALAQAQPVEPQP